MTLFTTIGSDSIPAGHFSRFLTTRYISLVLFPFFLPGLAFSHAQPSEGRKEIGFLLSFLMACSSWKQQIRRVIGSQGGKWATLHSSGHLSAHGTKWMEFQLYIIHESLSRWDVAADSDSCVFVCLTRPQQPPLMHCHASFVNSVHEGAETGVTFHFSI